MSAERCGVEPSADPSEKTFLFKQKVPIPSYLLAVVVGKLESRYPKHFKSSSLLSTAKTSKICAFEFFVLFFAPPVCKFLTCLINNDLNIKSCLQTMFTLPLVVIVSNCLWEIVINKNKKGRKDWTWWEVSNPTDTHTDTYIFICRHPSRCPWNISCSF